MFAHDFVVNAYVAGTFIALACGLTGWFVVLRGQVFAGDALSHVAFVGAIAAAVLAVDQRVGLFALTLVLAAAMASLGSRAQPDDVEIGIVFSWILGLGLLFITLLATSSGGGTGSTTASTLFGSIFTLGSGAAWLAAAIALAACLALMSVVRPLLFSTLDPELAAARGIPGRALGVGFLLLLAVVCAESTQAVGALLLLGLIAAPAGTAHQLTVRPWRGLALSGALAVGAMWGGLALSYAVPSLPPSSAVVGLAAGAYGVSAVARRARARARGRRGASGGARGLGAGAVPPS
jgi:zinc/manganese transport system permease protein